DQFNLWVIQSEGDGKCRVDPRIGEHNDLLRHNDAPRRLHGYPTEQNKGRDSTCGSLFRLKVSKNAELVFHCVRTSNILAYIDVNGRAATRSYRFARDRSWLTNHPSHLNNSASTTLFASGSTAADFR